MQVLDYTLLSKGAAITGSLTSEENPDQFTYALVDDSGQNLHVYSSEENEKWINCRDNGTALNADPSTIAKLLAKCKPSASA